MVLGFLLHVFLGELLGVGTIFPVSLDLTLFESDSTILDTFAWEIVVVSLLIPYFCRSDLVGAAALWLNRVNPALAGGLALGVFVLNSVANIVFVRILGKPDSTPDDRIDDEMDSLSGDPFAYGLFVLVITVIGPIIEELVFRGLIQTHVRSRLGPVWAIAISGALFGLLHGGPAPYAASLVFTGIVLGVLRERTGGISVPIVAHVVHNSLATVLT